MQKVTRFLILLNVFLMGFSAAPVNPIPKYQSETVLLQNVSFMGMGLGTGVLLDSTHVLTCAHMVETPKDGLMVFTYPLGKVVRSKILFMDKASDLLLLVLDSSVTVRTTPVFADSVTDGEPITVVGNALGSMHWIISKGVVSGEDEGYIITDALANPGNSGGPWFNAQGEIVALTDWGIGPTDHKPGVRGGVSGRHIHEFLASYKKSLILAPLLEKLFGI